MADSDLGEEGTSTTSFSQLLLSDDDNDIVGLDMDRAFHYTSTASATGNYPPRMICFGGFHHLQENQPDTEVFLRSEPTVSTLQKSSRVTCSDSSSASSVNNSSSSKNVNINIASRSNRKRNGSGPEPVQCTRAIAKTPLTSQRTSKKGKTDNLISPAYPKVRKEKLGERVTVLQQLVSPFGKTDTASVLHEAMGYIRFLQDQVQVLCSPYLQHQPEREENEGEEPRKDMKSRGLCLVPVEWTLQVASSNGADYWSSAMGNNFSPPSRTKQ